MEKALLPSERLIVTVLTCVAVLTFFFPVVTLQVPILGNQNYAGYEIIGNVGKFEQTMQRASSALSAPAGAPKAKPEELPGSVRIAWLSPMLITMSVGFAGIAFLATFRPAAQLVKAGALLGAVTAIAAIVHLSIINSDLHDQFRLAMKLAAQAREAEPNAFLEGVVADVVGNSIQLRPGTGLYALAICLAVTVVITYGRVLVRYGLVATPTAPAQPAPISQ